MERTREIMALSGVITEEWNNFLNNELEMICPNSLFKKLHKYFTRNATKIIQALTEKALSAGFSPEENLFIIWSETQPYEVNIENLEGATRHRIQEELPEHYGTADEETVNALTAEALEKGVTDPHTFSIERNATGDLHIVTIEEIPKAKDIWIENMVEKFRLFREKAQEEELKNRAGLLGIPKGDETID